MLHIYREFILKRLIYCLRHCINFVFYCYFVIPLRCQFLQHFDGWNFNFSTICAKSDGENEIYLDEISNTIFQKNMYFLFLVMIGKLIYQVIVLQYWMQNPQTRIFGVVSKEKKSFIIILKNPKLIRLWRSLYLRKNNKYYNILLFC